MNNYVPIVCQQIGCPSRNKFPETKNLPKLNVKEQKI